MSTAGRAYVVRDAEAGGPGAVIHVYAYTLAGLTSALGDARSHSRNGTPKVVAVMTEGKSTVIRRFERGRAVPLTPLPQLSPRLLRGSPIFAARVCATGGGAPRGVRCSVD